MPITRWIEERNGVAVAIDEETPEQGPLVPALIGEPMKVDPETGDFVPTTEDDPEMYGHRVITHGRLAHGDVGAAIAGTEG